MKHIVIVSLIFLSSVQLFGAVSPVSFGIVPPVQFPPSDYNVAGLRASILWGKHRDVYGLDLGLIGNITDQQFAGLAVSGIYNWTRGSTTIVGLQLAGVTNINTQKTKVVGLQAALGANYNEAASSVVGLQIALANLASHTTIYGLQTGVYNRALEVYGFQIGLVNVATDLHGLQIGLVNIHEKGLFKISPILNFGF